MFDLQFEVTQLSIPASDLDTCWMASCSCFLTSGVCSSNTSRSACSYSNALAMVKASPQLFLWLQPRFERMSHLELHTALETEGWTQLNPKNHRFQSEKCRKIISPAAPIFNFRGSHCSTAALGDAHIPKNRLLTVMSTWDLETPALNEGFPPSHTVSCHIYVNDKSTGSFFFHKNHQLVTHEGCRHKRNDHAAQDDQRPQQESSFTKAIGQRQQG